MEMTWDGGKEKDVKDEDVSGKERERDLISCCMVFQKRDEPMVCVRGDQTSKAPSYEPITLNVLSEWAWKVYAVYKIHALFYRMRFYKDMAL